MYTCAITGCSGERPTAEAAYPRDLTGHGPTTPPTLRPSGALLAARFVLNFEADGENAVLHGDQASEALLTDMVGGSAPPRFSHQCTETT